MALIILCRTFFPSQRVTRKDMGLVWLIAAVDIVMLVRQNKFYYDTNWFPISLSFME